MKLIEVDWTPGKRQLRQFAAAVAVLLPLTGWLFSWPEMAIAVLGGLGVALGGLAWLLPIAVRPLYQLVMLITLPVGLVLGELALLLLFLGIFMPLGCLLRRLRGDRLQRESVPESASYWQQKPPPGPIGQYYRQY